MVPNAERVADDKPHRIPILYYTLHNELYPWVYAALTAYSSATTHGLNSATVMLVQFYAKYHDAITPIKCPHVQLIQYNNRETST